MAKQRRGLGRGLDALLTGTSEEASPEADPDNVRQIALASIRPNPYQPRREFDEAQLSELSASIETHGLIQPLIVTRDEDGWCLIAGERRLRAAERAGLETVPVIVREADPQQMLAVAIIENVQREDLDPIEAAAAYRRLMDEFELTQAEVARMVGKSRPVIANLVRLLGLSDDVRSLVAAGHLSEGHGRALLGIEDEADQLRMARRVIAEGWTVRRVEDAVKAWGADAPPASDAPSERSPSGATQGEADPDTMAAVQALEGALGTKVEIRRQGERGQLVIHYHSEAALAALYDRLIGD